jgi:HK97 family phage portal protein
MNPLAWLGRLFKTAPPAAHTVGSWRMGRPLDKEWDSARAVKEGFKVNEVVYACVKRRANAVASVPWYVEERKDDYEWERVPGHPIEQLLDYPNPSMSRQDLFDRLVHHLDLAGNALWQTVDATSLRGPMGKVPVELWPVDPGPIKPVPDQKRFISEYEYYRDGDRKVIDASQVIHFMIADPSNPYWGTAPLMALAKAVDTQVAAMSWNLQALFNRAVPDGLMSFDRPLNREEWEQAQNEIRRSLSGDQNARRMLVLGSGAKYEMLSWTPTELDFIASLKHYREAIASAYGVPLPMISIYEDATLANLEGSRRIFWEDTVINVLEGISSTLNRVLVPRFAERGQIRLCYDVSAVPALREDFGAKCDQYVKLVEYGVSPNAARKRLEMDLEDEEGGDVALIPATMIPLTMVVESAEQQLRMGEATIENTEASTETTLKPVPPAKDPNKQPAQSKPTPRAA